ncbi:hypothetical protein [Kaistella jeonii]|uniref:Uncharacterized protein n=1 Tax=Kaistella jeonii TaxID=266749 RepID=A0A0C1F8X1_9FLAO|nr:hypothetical protein [Kaistella jeonii]KIA89577.1 hypothetical protein OA86_02775 [Kaistella jeonii]SFB90678.1 hypothetical protein SAMN05421876_103345 [Kaistella jeonii]VEI95782.1 Uncharacterised protein [Kaistella jeonii]
MKRILLSQNEHNDGTNYIVVDGKLLSKNPENLKYVELLSDTKDYKKLYKDGFITISEKDNIILFSSHYKDLDDKGRRIFYMYLLDKIDNLEKIIELLIQDSKVINKSIDYQMTLEIVIKIKQNSMLQRKLRIFIGVTLFALILSSAVIYLISKSNKTQQNTIKNERTNP